MILNIVLPGYYPQSANQMLRKHWAVRKREQSRLKWTVIDALASTGMPLPPIFYRSAVPMRMTVRVFRKRRLDYDNAIAGLKPLVDVIKELGIIHDDSPKWLDLGLDERIDLSNPRTEIDIEPMPARAKDKSKRR